MSDSYEFIDNKGRFALTNPQNSNYLYFPLCNDAGMKSSITPTLHGDIKLDQNRFVMQPVSVEELHNTKSARNFWINIHGKGVWSLTGNSAEQKCNQFHKDADEVQLEAGLLYHKIVRTNNTLNIASTVTTFVPQTEDLVELTKYTITNLSNETIRFTPTSAIPLYGRSADNYRDHRHVTSLLNRISVTDYGVDIKPTLTFDERGHGVNSIHYGVVGLCQGKKPIGAIPTVETFIGEGGNLEWPRTIIDNIKNYEESGFLEVGYEAIGSLCFEDAELGSGDSIDYVIAIYVGKSDYTYKKIVTKYCYSSSFDLYYKENQKHWEDKVDVVSLESSDSNFDNWMKWVTLQPILRRIYGCSFLPHHDYGRGGRGWRDLWQDCLALLFMEPKDVRFLLLNNFAGVRIDGSNATIIGDEPGEFKADRNNISRIWMDHGVWPFLTTKEYIHQTGDIDFLFEEQYYFKDKLIYRAKKIDNQWDECCENIQKTKAKTPYLGTIIEHLLIQNVSIFFNVGDHNNIKLEGADWNDALDMASEKGESVAFSGLYANNLYEISTLLKVAKTKKGIGTVTIAKEMLTLFDTIPFDMFSNTISTLSSCLDASNEDITNQIVDYNSVKEKTLRLEQYFKTCEHVISGEKIDVPIDYLCQDLERKSNWMVNHIRDNEFITDNEGHSWFNSYYDNQGKQVEGQHENGVRMMLTGQVFQIMGNVSTNEQTESIIKACKYYLFDYKVGGYRLNTNFKELKTDLGRSFGFAYGHKENGAMFSHMSIMYCNALYKRGFVKEAYELIQTLYQHCYDFKRSRIYPSIPEYINERGRGMYTYLTGSASWLLYTVVSEMYGCKALVGDLLLEPKLVSQQFKDKQVSITFLFNEKPLKIIYTNPYNKSFGEYKIHKVTSNEREIPFTKINNGIIIKRNEMNKLQKTGEIVLHVVLN